MVTKRALGASLLLLGLAFVGLFHTVAAFAFDSGQSGSDSRSRDCRYSVSCW
ncbi:hypothetical protein ACFQH2_03160 [Natronoarchaeum sp. GCM10025703]|uniref:hypothetical protein n=1 Tax=Natronoarchaeum sp. GCM10025703 TaxID=3252685 RepID=UPI00361491F4